MAKAHILVVEDEEDIQELVRYNLTKVGYEVTSVMSGEEGLRCGRLHHETLQPTGCCRQSEGCTPPKANDGCVSSGCKGGSAMKGSR